MIRRAGPRPIGVRGGLLAGLTLTLLLLGGAARGATSDPAPTPYARAVELYRAGRLPEASAVLEQAIAAGETGAGYHALLGWCRLRLSDVTGAAAAFDEALRRDPQSIDALTGSGYVSLRNGRLPEARDRFSRAVERDPQSGDAWKGLGLAQRGLQDPKSARESFRRAVRLSPDDREAAEMLEENLRLIVEERRPRPPAGGEQSPRLVSRARNAALETLHDGSWSPLFVKGVNLGTALPGRFPAEFPDDPTLYREWFDLMGEMGANVVRLYTLHPPSLYRALAQHNRQRPQQKLWLIQGAWTELPPGDDFGDPAFVETFHAEIRRVIDAVHGNLELPQRPGHAHGVYDVDLSEDLLALLLGREWEPFAVEAYNRKPGAPTRFAGRFLQTGEVQPIEAWLAEVCEVAAAHANDYYGWQHPVGITSWPTLDPLVHPTEATVEEEMKIRGRVGRVPEKAIREYDNDGVQVDVHLIRSTPRFAAGTYAAYHAYPYYPDFMFLEPAYAKARDAEGISRYLGYLRALREHHGEQPVLIAEFGVPSSRGIAHLHPEGQHHGGHDDLEQGRIDLRLLGDIRQAGLAGGVLFSWVDEWFKRNWVVMHFQSPRERMPLWLNALDAEQNYGLLAAWPGQDGWKVVLDGRDDDWRDVAPLYDAGAQGDYLKSLRVTADEAYLYLGLRLYGNAGALGPRRQVWIGIDTYDAARGSHRFPHQGAKTSLASLKLPIGMEFLIRLAGPEESRILVDRPYDLFSNRNRRPYRSLPNDKGDFIEIEVFTNRDRFGRDGTFFPARGYSRSPLRRGSTDRASPDYTTLADWYAAGGWIEARIPWGLLNVADPSSRRVIHETTQTEGMVQTATTDGFRFHVLLVEDRGKGPEILAALPAAADAPHPTYRWPTWERPTYRLEPKRAYDYLKQHLSAVTP